MHVKKQTHFSYLKPFSLLLMSYFMGSQIVLQRVVEEIDIYMEKNKKCK